MAGIGIGHPGVKWRDFGTGNSNSCVSEFVVTMEMIFRLITVLSKISFCIAPGSMLM